jgi:MFS family permease
VVTGAFMTMTLVYGMRYSFGVFVKPMFAEYNWPMTIIQLGASINLIVYATTCIFAGWLLDHIRPKWIMIVGIISASCGLVMSSHVQTPLGLYFSYGLLVGAGSACSGMVVLTVSVGRWFARYQGLAIGIASMGIGIGTMLMAPLASFIVHQYGWRFGFLSIGILLLAAGLLITTTLMGKRGPEQLGLLPDGIVPEAGRSDPSTTQLIRKASLAPVLKSGPYWNIVFCNFMAVMTVMMTFSCQVAYAINQGISELEAATALGIIGMTGSLGKFGFGWLCDRVKDPKTAASVGFAVMGVGMIVLYQAKTLPMLYCFAFIYGFGYGSLAPVMPYMIADRFGQRILGSAYGLLVFFSAGCGGGIGPLLGGILFDRTGSYKIGWLVNAMALFLVMVVILLLKPKGSRSA